MQIQDFPRGLSHRREVPTPVVPLVPPICGINTEIGHRKILNIVTNGIHFVKTFSNDSKRVIEPKSKFCNHTTYSITRQTRHIIKFNFQKNLLKAYLAPVKVMNNGP